MSRALLAALLAAVAVAGCASGEARTDADCAALLDWNGVRYQGAGTRGPAELGERLGEGSLPGCDDGGGPVEDEAVEVFAVAGVAPEIAVAVPGHDAVYLAPDYAGPGAEYPEALEPVLLGPPCSEPEPFVLTGELVGGDRRRLTLTVEGSGTYGGLDLTFLVTPDAVVPSVSLDRYAAFDRFRVLVRCRKADLPNRTYLAEEVSFVANGNRCGRYSEPCHVSEGPPQPAVRGGSAAQRTLLAEVAAGLGPSSLTALALRPAGEGVELAAEAPRPLELRAEWEAWLVAGAFRDRSGERGLPPVTSLSIGTERRELARGPWEGGLDDPRALSREIHRADGRSSVHFDEYAILRPEGVVPALTFRTDDGARFLRRGLPRFLAGLGDPVRYEGISVRVEDPDGQPLWEWARSSRLGAEAFAAVRGLDGCRPLCPGG